MASVSASHLILFIASMLVAASVAGVFTDTVGQLSQAISDEGLDVSDDVRTDVEVISDSGSDAVYDGGTITLYLKNTGSRTLAAESDMIDVFVDGAYDADLTLSLVDGAERWRPGDVVEMGIDESLPDGEDHRVKVIVDGDEEVFEFRT